MQETHDYLLASVQGKGTDECDQCQKIDRDMPREFEVRTESGQTVPTQTQQHLHPTQVGKVVGCQEREGKEGAARQRKGAGVAEDGSAASVGQVEE